MSPFLIAIGIAAAYLYFRRKGTQAPDAQSSRLSPKSLVVILNALSVVAGVFYLLTVNSSVRFASVLSSIIASLLVIFANYGVPKISRAAIRQPLQDYFGRCMSGAEFPFLFFSLMFVNDSTSQLLGIIPFGIADYVSAALIIRRSLWFVGSHGTTSWKGIGLWDRFFQPIWGRLNTHSGTILELASVAEILLGFWLILLVLTPARQLMVCFVYWNFLRIRYLAPRSRQAHIRAWAQLDKKTKNFQNAVPISARPIAFMKQWFNPTGPTQ
jgi:hypothetical protein